MSFDPRYLRRFERIFTPAISGIHIGNLVLETLRVDLSKTGDPILTEIVDGMAHSQMVVADVSVTGKDSVTGKSYRNANVLYEVGIALACRQSSEVLLVRDDTEEFLFDLSVVPHKTIDFTKETLAIEILRSDIVQRLKQRTLINDARVDIAISTLTPEGIEELISNALASPMRTILGESPSSGASKDRQIARSRLLDRQLLERDRFAFGGDLTRPIYRLTQFGLAVLSRLRSRPSEADFRI
jgi:hypothetical protein